MNQSTANRLYLPALVIFGLIVLWEGIVRALDVPQWLLPAPTAVAKAFWTTRDQLAPHVGQTLLETALGISVAVTLGVMVAALLDFSPWLRRVVYPLLVLSQTIPILALAPLLIIWFGFGIVPKVIVVTLFW